MSELSDVQAQFQSEVRRFAQAEIAPHATAWDDGDDAYPRHLFGALGKLGWLGIGFDDPRMVRFGHKRTLAGQAIRSDFCVAIENARGN